MDCSPPGSSVHGIFQARVLEWGAISFSRGSSRPRDQTWVSRVADRRFTVWATREAQLYILGPFPPKSLTPVLFFFLLTTILQSVSDLFCCLKPAHWVFNFVDHIFTYLFRPPLCSMQDLSSPTRYRTWKHRVLSTGPPENSLADRIFSF